MADRKTFTVSVTPEQHAFIHDRLKSGRFSSVSEVVRAGLRLLERDEAMSAARAGLIVPEASEPSAALLDRGQLDA